MVKKILIALAVVLAILLVWQHELVSYGIMQAKGQIKVLWSARPIDELLADPQVADSLKQKVQLVQEVKKFAVDSLGVSDSGSYRSVYDQQGKPVLWVITATEPFSLEDREWQFPLLGTFSYKGFFDYQRALDEKEELAEQGLDTGIRTVSAWSTLGFFDDPILSQLLFRSEGQVANTVIHELTHGTIFVKDSLQFNENVASLIGDQGALDFLSYKHGSESNEVQEYIRYLEDRKAYINHMLRGTTQLDSMYQSFTNNLPKKVKLKKKKALIQEIVATTDTLRLRTRQYQRVRDKLQNSDKLPNNTFFKSYVRYRRNINDLRNELTEQFAGDIRQYLTYLQEKYD